MTPGDDGAGRPSGLSRRQLLAGIGGVGAVGMASGLGTGAYLADRETFSKNTFGSGTVELLVNGATTDGTINVNVSGINRGDSDRERFEIGAQTNPVRVWLATECVPSDALSRALEVDLRADGASLTGGYRPLADVRADLLTGERIDDGCLDPEDEDTIMVDVYWRLPADAPDAAANSSTSLTFLLYAEQCRHVDEPNAVGPASLDEASAAASNPFADRVCDENQCVPCAGENGVKIGGLTLRCLSADPIDLTVRATGGGAGGRGNGGTEIFAATVQPDEEFVLDGADSGTNDGSGWIGPELSLDDGAGPSSKGDGGVNIHTSCSDPLGPGDVYGDFEIVAVTTTDGKLVCESGTGGDRDDDTLDDPETDPECVVCDRGNDVSLATLDVRYRGAVDATVSVVSTKGGTGGELFAGTVSRGDVFTLNGKDVDRPGKGTDKLGPEVEISIEGEQRPVAIHVSCSQLLAVGDVYGDFEIDGGTTTGGEPLCGSEAN
ncbi:SipW-cognate class signal peptide [Halorubrum xinjiangense]|uniref:SipW-cognate class signal peptide n=1 Tax=Halorubrum xinjiangense TaxID=261291 RepID=A0A1G7QWE0_9EURY|nr:SipW-dependent-type signal peptide-containing protein [Halorubrum xinjiangense]SDG02832.1 SipW-cognate class signal peptide [Halorubrum xinjiangense]